MNCDLLLTESSCRFCLGDAKDGTPLYSRPKQTFFCVEKRLIDSAEVFRFLDFKIDFETQHPDVPNKICLDCKKLILSFYALKRNFQENESVMLAQISKTPTIEDSYEETIKKDLFPIIEPIFDEFLKEHPDEGIHIFKYTDKIIISPQVADNGVKLLVSVYRRSSDEVVDENPLEVYNQSDLSNQEREDDNDNSLQKFANEEDENTFTFVSTASNEEIQPTNSQEFHTNEEYLEVGVIEVSEDTPFEHECSYIEEVKQEPNKSDVGKFECLYCAKIFISRSGRDTHQQLKHRIPKEFDASEIDSHEVEAELSSGELVRAWKCPLCNLVSRRKNHHQTHLIRHAIRDKEETNKHEFQETNNLLISQSKTLRFVDGASFETAEHSVENNVPNRLPTIGLQLQKKIKSSYYSHVVTHTDRESDYYSCSSCNAVFKDKDSASVHVSKYGAVWTRMCSTTSCVDCGVVFVNENLLKRHQGFHGLADVARRLVYNECLECSVIFKNQIDLESHLQDHSSEHFQYKPETTTQLDGCEVIVKDLQANPGPTDFRCGHCVKFGSREYLNFHITLFHANLICPIDNQDFSRSLGYFYDHMKIKHPYEFESLRFDCPVPHCGESFTTRASMIDHCRTCTKKRFSCDHCDMRFHLRRQQENHMKLVKGIKKHKCEDCGKNFVNKTELNVHARSHTNLKPYRCLYAGCNKSFRTSSHRSAHADTHSSVRIYKCKHCPEMFHTRGSKRIHEQTHADTFMSSCYLCHREFSQRSHYVRHVNAVHSIKCSSINLEKSIEEYTRKVQLEDVSQSDEPNQ